jgi:hypothetical protein
VSRWRIIAQRALTGEFLDLELPLSVSSLAWDLSGPGSLVGVVSPDTGVLRAPDGRLLLEEWGTLIYAEADGVIRWGGIVVASKFDGAQWSVECAGFTTYPTGLPFQDTYSRTGIDPAQIVRDLWAHVQAHPDGDLGVVVTGGTPVRLGTPENPDDRASGPYELLWSDAPDVGREIDSLAQEAPFDYIEEHAWSAGGDSIEHAVRIAYPRAGRRRDDLAFIQGDNVVSVVTPQIDGDAFANEVVGIGAGEGTGSLRRTTAVRDGRLRRTHVYTAKDVTSAVRLDAQIRDALTARGAVLDIDAVEVIDHPNAPIGSWALGDDVLIEADLPWLGSIAVWCRITGWELLGETRARLSLARSDTFTYGG